MMQFNELEAAAAYGEPVVVALGNFDGVHKGHRRLLEVCIEKARSLGLRSAVLTFSNHPANVIAGKALVKNIITLEEKARLFESMGLDCLFSVPFDERMRRRSPEDFCHLLARDLSVKEVVCGFNYHFGYRGAGTPELMVQEGLKLGYGVEVVPPLLVGGEPVSSSRVRKAVAEGDMEVYEELVGRRYTLDGRVIQGRRFGRTIGFPTINLALDVTMVLPRSGVYLTRTSLDGVVYNSITNVGRKPTVGLFDKNAETHIFDFDREIYGRKVRVEFMALMRPELTFDTLEELTKAIEEDCERARSMHLEYERKAT